MTYLEKRDQLASVLMDNGFEFDIDFDFTGYIKGVYCMAYFFPSDNNILTIIRHGDSIEVNSVEQLKAILIKLNN